VDLIAQLPAMLAMLMFGAMLAVYTQVVAVRRKDRYDHRRYRQRIRRNHGGSWRGRRPPPGA
jgi:hypothetical protein